MRNPNKIAINCCNVGGGGGGGGGGWRGPEFEVPCGPPSACAVIGTAHASATTRHIVVKTSLSFFIVFLLLGYFRVITAALG